MQAQFLGAKEREIGWKQPRMPCELREVLQGFGESLPKLAVSGVLFPRNACLNIPVTLRPWLSKWHSLALAQLHPCTGDLLGEFS